MSIPREIVDSVKAGECILFLGAMATAALPPEDSKYVYVDNPPGGQQLARNLATKFLYPYGDPDNLQRVSLFIETQPRFRRSALVKGIIEQLTQPNIKPSPALNMLAALPFRLILTTNYDHLFEQALRSVAVSPGKTKDPIIITYNPTGNSRFQKLPIVPEADRPLLLKIHGDIDYRDSIVVTEEDYIQFIYRMGNEHLSPIPKRILSLMADWPTLFIGYGLKDLNLRLLLKTLRWQAEDGEFPISSSVDPSPDDLIVSVYQDGEKPMVSFIKQDLWHFVPELYEACTGNPYTP